MTGDIQKMRSTKLQTHKRWSKGREVELGRRGAILALQNQKNKCRKPLPERTIAKELQIRKSTVYNIIAHNRQLIAENSVIESPMSEVNLVSFRRSGRPPRLTASMKLEVIATATRNATQRRKSFAQLAREMPFSIHRTSLAKILQNAGYDKNIPLKKPHITGKNIEKRKEFSDSLKDEPIQVCFDGWVASDEMYLLARSHYGPERVIRKANEEYHPDCSELEWPGQVRLMFWGAIAHNKPCSESTFFVWEEETAKEQELALEMLAEENRVAEEEVQEAQNTWYEEEMAQRKHLPKGQQPQGRPANPYKITKNKRVKTTKGGIDWFRYRESICEANLYPFYRRLLGSAERGE